MSIPSERFGVRSSTLHRFCTLSVALLLFLSVLRFPTAQSTDSAAVKTDPALRDGDVSESSRIANARKNAASYAITPKRIAPLKNLGGRRHVASAQQVTRYSVIGQQNYDIQLRNNGGNIMTARVRVYLIFYGSWPQGGKKQQIVETFVRSLGNASMDAKGNTLHKWWNLNSLYTQPDGKRGSVAIVHKTSVFVKSTAPLSSSSSVAGVVRTLINKGRLPADANAIYAVLTTSDIKVGNDEDGYCVTYCGWHSSFFSGGYRMKFLFASDATKCDGCSGTSTRYVTSRSPSPCTKSSASAMLGACVNTHGYITSSVSFPLPRQSSTKQCSSQACCHCAASVSPTSLCNTLSLCKKSESTRMRVSFSILHLWLFLLPHP